MIDFVSKFDVDFAPKLGIRSPTFRAVLREALVHAASNIVETGCMRKADNWQGDGQSTLIWKALRMWNGKGTFDSVDINEEAVTLAKEACSDDSFSRVTCSDSVKFLYDYKGLIDVLYLDSYDVDMDNPHLAAQHALFELTAAMPKLHTNSIVFIDDSPVSVTGQVGGKGGYVSAFMNQLGVAPFTFGYQIAWLLP